MKNILWMRKSIVPLVLAFFLSTFILALPIPTIAQPNSTTTVYLDPPTINGTVAGQEFNVSIMIRDAIDVYSWQSGLTFDPAVLNCTGFFRGEFLEDIAPGQTWWVGGTINNTAGVIDPPYSELFLGDYSASGDGRLAYATFKVKAPGVSDVHLRDILLGDYPDNEMIPANIVDVFTVAEVTPSQTVVTVSNSTGVKAVRVNMELVTYGSGFYDHVFNASAEEISFNVTGPDPGFSEVTIPKALLSVDALDEWKVIIDGTPLSTEDRTITENGTHYSIYFTYSLGIHEVRVTSRTLIISIISIALSSASITVESSVTISGGIGPVRSGATVTIQYRKSGGTWTTLDTVTTDQNGNYSYTWTPETAGTYEVKASWEGDQNTEGDESNVKTVTVKGAEGIDPYIIVGVVVAIIVIAAVVVYFVKIRKPEEE